MAGDWIKMRIDLSDDPAVVTMASALGRSEFEVVGALHRIWCWADRHTTDGTAPGITPAWLDRYIFAGFSAAIEAVGWITFDAAGITFVGFDKHNGKSAKTRAEGAVRQRLSRENRDNGETGCARTNIPKPIARAVLTRDGYQCVYCGEQSSAEKEAGKRPILSIDHLIPESRGGACNMANLVTCCRACNNEKNDRTPGEWGVEPVFLQPGIVYGGEEAGMSQKKCDKPVTREEKKREKKKEQTSATPAARTFGVPEWVPADEWEGFVEMRTRIRHPLTSRAALLVVKELERLKAKGYAPADILDASTRNGWRDVFEPRAGKGKPDDAFGGVL